MTKIDITKPIICGDNLKVMREMLSESVDLIYLDPPFFSDDKYESKLWDNAKFSDKWAEDNNQEKKYSEYTKVVGIHTYLQFMRDRIREMHRILKPTGSIYLHCDYHASHYLKIEMDKIFGYDNFQNEIIVNYQGKISPAKSKFPRSHDIILFYSKSKEYTFNPQIIKRKEALKRQKFDRHIDENGKPKQLALRDENGEVVYEMSEYEKTTDTWYNMWDDMWNDLPRLQASYKEYLDYPTQKPEALLERIISASSNSGDIIFDPFMGGGTTLAVAKRLNRKFIGIDESPVACKITLNRLRLSESESEGLLSWDAKLRSITDPYVFQQLMCDKLSAICGPKGGDGGKDGIIVSDNPKYNGCPLQVKQSERIGVNVIRNLYSVIHEMGKRYGVIVAYSYGKGAIEKVAEYESSNDKFGGISIKLITTDELEKIEKYQYS